MAHKLRLPRKKHRSPEERARRRRRRLAVLPSLCTLGNAVCGFAAIVQVAALQVDPATMAFVNPQNLTNAGWLILLGMMFDGMDGRLARMTQTAGDFGGELDSLCDAVSFGVAPGIMVAMVNAEALGSPLFARIAWLCGMVFACCAILRLARFNVENTPDEHAHQMFKGLPTPAAAGTVVSLVLLMSFLRSDREVMAYIPADWAAAVASWIPALLPFVALACAYFMVSSLPYVHVANRFLRGRRSILSIGRILIVGMLCFAIVPEFTMAVTGCGFVLSGPVVYAYKRLSGQGVREAGGGLDDSMDDSIDDPVDGASEDVRTDSADSETAEGSSDDGGRAEAG